MTIKEYDALITMIKHSEIDMNYGEGGSFNCGDGEFDQKDEKQVKEAIKYISRLLIKKQHQMASKKINRAFASGKISIDI